MRWPWVAARHLTWLEHQMTEVTQALYWEQQRYDALLDKYHALKLQGAGIPDPPVVREPVKIDPVTAAINAAAGRDRQLRSYMAQEAKRMSDAGYGEHEILQKIQEGVSAPEGLPA